MKKVFTIISTILSLLIISGIIFLIVIKPNVILINDLKVEINSSIKTNDFIKDIKHGSIISKNIEIDTTKLGTKEVSIKINSNINNKNQKIKDKYSTTF